MTTAGAPLPEYFTSRPIGTGVKPGWILECKRCPQRWELSPVGAAKPGNLLFLLNHAKGHDARDAARASKAVRP